MSALTAELRPHPRTPCDAVRRVGLASDPDDWPRPLRVRFRVDGDMGRTPYVEPPAAADKEGRH